MVVVFFFEDCAVNAYRYVAALILPQASPLGEFHALVRKEYSGESAVSPRWQLSFPCLYCSL